MKHLLYLLVIWPFLTASAQQHLPDSADFPTDYFQSPLDIPWRLSGTFAELRTDHFHAGVDIKTQQREGLAIYAVAGGYISRIKVGLFGYGKALYITHPNGYTSVYAHLQKFNAPIERYLKKRQYRKKSYEIQLFPHKDSLLVEKNDLVALSGSTGGFVAPHLHFEIRDTESEQPINPFLFGMEVADHKKPRIQALVGYPLGKDAHIKRSEIPVQLSFIKQENGDLLARKISAYGPIGFGINAYDQQDGSYNKNGLYQLEMYVNGKMAHAFNARSFSFSKSKYLNLLIDYERYVTLKQRIQKCFTEPANKLDMYSADGSNGYINIEDGKRYDILIIARDFKGNEQQIRIPIVGSKEAAVNKLVEKTTPYKIAHTAFHKFTKRGVSVAFPKNTFYQDLYLDFKVSDSLVQVHTPTRPLHKKYTLTFDVSTLNETEKAQTYIASVDRQGKTGYQKTVKKDSTFYTSTGKLGNFKLARDIEKPLISWHNFRDGQWLTHFEKLEIKIKDEGSGVHSYQGTIDGQWILMEYNLKKNVLTYDLRDISFTKAAHQLDVTVTDNVGNSVTKSATFYRKK